MPVSRVGDGGPAAAVPFQDLIKKKRDGEKLTDADMKAVVEKVVNKQAEDAQIGAMLMAMFLKGLDAEETASLTRYMVDTGDKMDWCAASPEWTELLVDKHSTGGVGDKVSLPLAPALAACGFKVPMMSGRGLDFTGGTLDKLESIRGFTVQQPVEAMRRALEDPGCFIVGPTAKLAPADGELYKRRDVTGTVDNIPLITSSIVSKKVAEGTRALVMDIKVGRAALFKTVESASDLARSIIAVAKLLGVPTRAVLTRMDVPIGRAVGNALEVAESIRCLRGQGPQDLEDLVCALGGELLEMRGAAATAAECRERVRASLRDGSALEAFRRMLVRQGVSEADARRVCGADDADLWAVLPRAPHTTPVRAAEAGFVADIEGLPVARACQRLGAGRARADDVLDLSVGVVLDDALHVGAEVRAGDVLMVVHHRQDAVPADILAMLQGAVRLQGEPPVEQPRGRVITTLS
ncbi:thymidine phosphorylase-like [Thrips palmi]|uniref:Thymidine phosphorylase n=1 Tax=Thrips palmi TaxID=161013 RepID=A0A6P8Z1Y0_THRPL|nr:thymidine phosphorylase-like [Thrips palmi]XP_034246499.1 thymidine phosphorylase-like [Thrips palmi]